MTPCTSVGFTQDYLQLLMSQSADCKSPWATAMCVYIMQSISN